ncbi:MAG: hypothetical protein ACWA5P_05825 [bacterium]
MESSPKHWTSELLILFGIWLWEKKEYGHALLCITGPHWGYKIGTQLKIAWDEILASHDDDILKYEIEPTFSEYDGRPITELAREYLYKLYHLQTKTIEGDESIYQNTKTGKPLTTSTLNRELQRFSKDFLAEVEDKIGWKPNLKPIKSNAFEIAWALKMLEKYHYSKKAFVFISKYMGHRTLKDTIKLLEVEPFDDIVLDFHGPYVKGGLSIETLNDKDMMWRFARNAENDAYTRFKWNIE